MCVCAPPKDEGGDDDSDDDGVVQRHEHEYNVVTEQGRTNVYCIALYMCSFTPLCALCVDAHALCWTRYSGVRSIDQTV